VRDVEKPKSEDLQLRGTVKARTTASATTPALARQSLDAPPVGQHSTRKELAELLLDEAG